MPSLFTDQNQANRAALMSGQPAAPVFAFGYGDTAETTWRGYTLTAEIEPDDTGETPWDRDYAFGPVSDWRPFDSKRPGERVLNRDGDGTARFYDFAEAVQIARRDGWGIKNPPAGATAGQIAALAAEADFRRLADWCSDRWSYVGVVVTARREGVKLGSASLWGIESDAGDYLAAAAADLADQACDDADATLAKLTAAPQ